MKIYEVRGLVWKSFPRIMTHANIQSSFRVTGIYSLDRKVFNGEEVLSYVTDLPLNEFPAATKYKITFFYTNCSIDF